MKKNPALIIGILLVITAGFFISTSNGSSLKNKLKTGDVIFQKLNSELSKVISQVTESELSHCGMIIKDKEGSLLVIEAVGPVRIIPFDEFINHGIGKKFAIVRMKDTDGIDFDKVVTEAKKLLNRPYDFQYRFDDEFVYCSELVYKAFDRGAGIKIAKIVKLKDLKYENNLEFIKSLTGGDVPLEREMVTPVDIYLSDLFYKVYSNY